MIPYGDTMSYQDRDIYISFKFVRSGQHVYNGHENFQGPGWYVDMHSNEGYDRFQGFPRRITFSQALALAEAFSKITGGPFEQVVEGTNKAHRKWLEEEEDRIQTTYDRLLRVQAERRELDALYGEDNERGSGTEPQA